MNTVIKSDTSKSTFCNEDIRKMLIQADIQPTVQRISLLKYILCEADHPTAEEVRMWALSHLGQISQATVYNALGTFVEAGLLRMFKFPHTDKVIYDCNTRDHFHFLDESSGKLYDVDAHQVVLQGELPLDYKVNSYEILFKGKVQQTNKKESVC